MPEHILSKVLSNEEASKLVIKGLPWGEAEFLATQLDIDLAVLARLTGISASTFFRRNKGSRRFTSAESDHIMRFSRLWALALQVFENPVGAREWLKSPEISLHGRVPLDVSVTEAGAREVETLLKRIDYGIAS
jgi:putative toxin-antitoxin system antitoxin component (TIGR02293 family)